MKPIDVTQMKPQTPVWVWVVRMSKGRWWPGTVESISCQGRLPLLNIRFECQRFRDAKWNGRRENDMTIARMRHLELRDPHVKAIDRPRFTPTPLIEKEERPDPSLLGATEIADEKSLPHFIRDIFRLPRHNSSLARILGKFDLPK